MAGTNYIKLASVEFAGTFNIKSASPLDVRFRVDTESDLINSTVWCDNSNHYYLYNGMTVATIDTGDLYILSGATIDTSTFAWPNLTMNNWHKLGSAESKGYVWTAGTAGTLRQYGTNSFAEGEPDSLDSTSLPTASGRRSHAEGYATVALGPYSHAEGYETRALGNYAHASGSGSTAVGNHSSAQNCSTAVGENSHSEGEIAISCGEGSHSEGGYTHAHGGNSHAEGRRTIAWGDYSHAEGHGDDSSVVYSSGFYFESEPGADVTIVTVTGYTTDLSDASTIFFYDDISSRYAIYYFLVSGVTKDNQVYTITCCQKLIIDDPSIIKKIEVYYNPTLKAKGNGSHAEGYCTIAEGNYSHAEGLNTIAGGGVSHAEGFETKADGNYAHAEGYGTTASSNYQHVSGKYNVEDTSDLYAFIVGNGSVDTPSNGFSVDWNGRAYAPGGFFLSSDSQLKNIIGTLDLKKAYLVLETCSPILYTLKTDPENKRLIGLVALEIEEFFPELVFTDASGYKSLDYSRITVILVEVLKDLIGRVNKLEKND